LSRTSRSIHTLPPLSFYLILPSPFLLRVFYAISDYWLQSLDLPRLDRIIRCSLRSQGLSNRVLQLIN
jgi:hypothetical protein